MIAPAVRHPHRASRPAACGTVLAMAASGSNAPPAAQAKSTARILARRNLMVLSVVHSVLYTGLMI